MATTVFVSRPTPYRKAQVDFLTKIEEYLKDRGFSPRTLGSTDYSMDSPLKAIRQIMLESNGIITIAFRRGKIIMGENRPDTDKASSIKNEWTTSAFCHIETAMAYQIGLPILMLREKGVIEDGVFDHGVADIYLPEFDLDATDKAEYLNTEEWRQLIAKWEAKVRTFAENREELASVFASIQLYLSKRH